MKVAAVDGRDATAVERALRAVLDDSGPAVFIGGAVAGAPAGGLPAVCSEHRPLAVPGEVVDGTALVLRTSGSTGVPKTVALGREAILASARATAARVGEGSWLLALPTLHIAGLQVVIRALLAGTTPVIPQTSGPTDFAAATDRLGTGTRLVSLVPAQLATLLEAAEDDHAVRAALASFDAILVGGQRTPAHVLHRAHELGARIVRTYGSTETSGGCVYDGRPLDGVTLRTDESGEVLIAGPMLAAGYLGAPDPATGRAVVDGARSAASFSLIGGTRWYRTGDLGAIDVDGTLSITGRADNVIVSGGVNISLDRVEQAVHTMPTLRDAVVVAVTDERWGEASVIVTARGSDADLGAAREVVRREVSPYAQPARVMRVDVIPLLPSGKPDREALRGLAVLRP